MISKDFIGVQVNVYGATVNIYGVKSEYLWATVKVYGESR